MAEEEKGGEGCELPATRCTCIREVTYSMRTTVNAVLGFV